MLIASIKFVNSQLIDTIWTKTYGGNQNDFGYSIAEVSAQKFILAGYTSSFGVQGIDYYIVKINENGEVLWSKTYGGIYRDEAYSIASTSDHGSIVCGWSSSFASGRNIWVVKLDSLGDTLWTRVYGGQGHEIIYSTIETEDYGFLAAGYTASFGAGGEGVWLLKLDADGDTMWTKTIGATGNERAHSLLKTTDGSYLVLGYTTSKGAVYADFYLLKLNVQTGIISDLSRPFLKKYFETLIIKGPLSQEILKNYKIYDSTGRNVKTTNPGAGMYFGVRRDNSNLTKLVKIQ
ncbi:MAG: hypothetical protein N3A65_01555 [candidate division WOR-3 bacterium]|nr:hypothetical protein [candidate division WOR-3 bacterium]